MHAEGERVILTRTGGARQEIDLAPPAAAGPAGLPEPVCPAGVVSDLSSVAAGADPLPPGVSALDGPAAAGGQGGAP
jgi:hypothetical protein